MIPTIHPTAIVSEKAEIGENVAIGPYAVVHENVIIEPGTKIGSHTAIEPFTHIGPDCDIFPFAAIGGTPQAIKFKGEETWVKIGRGTIVREFVTIHRGTAFGGGVTQVGEENFLMAYCHIAHDCKTGRQVIMANNATLAGHITIDDYATIGGLTAVHQFVRIGRYAYVGGKSAVTKDVPPFVMASGDRARLFGLNLVGLKRRGVSPEAILQLKRAYRIIFRFSLTLHEAIERTRAEVDQLPEVLEFIEFLQSSDRGITR